MTEIMQEMAAQLAPVAAGLVATLISVALVRAIRWLKAREGMEAVAAAAEMVAATVNEMNATTVQEIKEAAADGKLTMSEANIMKENAVQAVKTRLPKSMASAATKVVGDLDAYIRGKIEKEVAAAKALQPIKVEALDQPAKGEQWAL